MGIRFTKIDNNLIVDKEIDSNTFRVYVYMISLYNKEKGYSFPSIRTMSNKLGISTPTIQKAIKKLKELNYIVVNQMRNNANNIMNIYKSLKHLILDHIPAKSSDKITDNQRHTKESKLSCDSYKRGKKILKFNNYKQREYSNLEYDSLLGWD